ncbi:MAG: hypothetical protein KJ851_03815, partial [Nanoarchaeota archaeon]|nr:hypothetical protein [Nanoarchaeota archaeon]
MKKHTKVENSSVTTFLMTFIILSVIVFGWSFGSSIFSDQNKSSQQETEPTNSQNIVSGISEYIQPAIQKTPQQQCEEIGSSWCNGQCYTSCSNNQRFNCPSNGAPSCINTKNIEDVKKSIVWVKYEVTGKNEDGSYFENGGSGSGVIFSNTDSKLFIYTNRHVLDCGFNDMKCYSRLTEKTSVRTQDGQIYPV